MGAVLCCFQAEEAALTTATEQAAGNCSVAVTTVALLPYNFYCPSNRDIGPEGIPYRAVLRHGELNSAEHYILLDSLSRDTKIERHGLVPARHGIDPIANDIYL
jgi:hypothetical protein